MKRIRESAAVLPPRLGAPLWIFSVAMVLSIAGTVVQKIGMRGRRAEPSTMRGHLAHSSGYAAITATSCYRSSAALGFHCDFRIRVIEMFANTPASVNGSASEKAFASTRV
jgi:hypothetical protein